MYPRIPWKLVVDPLRRAERILGTTGLRGLEKKNKISVAAEKLTNISQHDIGFRIRKCFRHLTTNMILKVYANII
jgi:hypothetical protein